MFFRWPERSRGSPRAIALSLRHTKMHRARGVLFAHHCTSDSHSAASVSPGGSRRFLLPHPGPLTQPHGSGTNSFCLGPAMGSTPSVPSCHTSNMVRSWRLHPRVPAAIHSLSGVRKALWSSHSPCTPSGLPPRAARGGAGWGVICLQNRWQCTGVFLTLNDLPNSYPKVPNILTVSDSQFPNLP